MAKALVLCAAVFFVFWCHFACAAQRTYQLNGRNRATVNTGFRRCCNGRVTEVTESVAATLYDKNRRRTNFGSSRFTRRMSELDKQPGDQKGHILASFAGGPAEIWNLAPQADNVNKRLLNRNSILAGWYECENWIKRELERGRNLPVRATMRLSYGANCRPTHWSIEARNSNPNDPGCRAVNIRNGFGGSFTCRKH
ncbi:uncharacterized protein LOC132707390 [Cylas formicarius]|uniref:uncharacterized protein LOC132707390 n=1 Tax=Cylas formicarius TaxID=197179 RepID=UPI00295867C6|nr:uncharacterized protein LOC132707390 [Cylas formicarius]